jgi:hypothetical protein
MARNSGTPTEQLRDDDDEDLDEDQSLRELVDDEFEGLAGAIEDRDSAPPDDDDEEEIPVDGEGDDDDRGDDDDADGADGPQRDERGRFAPKADDKPDAAAEAPRAGGSAAPAAAAAAAPAADAAKWETFAVRADKAILPIDEAQVTRANGHVLIAVKENDYNRFTQRIAKGVAAERVWRELHTAKQEVELERNAPRPLSDAEIEAKIIMDEVRPLLAELFDEGQLERLELKVKLAQREAKDTHVTDRTTYFNTEREKLAAPEREREAAAADERTQLESIASELLSLQQQMPELAGMTKDQIERAFHALAHANYRRAAVWKDGDAWYANHDLMRETLKQHAAATATGGTPGATGHTATAPTGGARTNAERFNTGVNSAPRTTSLKANRDARPRAQRPSRDSGRRRPAPDAAMTAEDEYRRTTRKFMNSNSLEFEGDED